MFKFISIVMFACITSFAFAHDKMHPVSDKMHDWFMGLRSEKGPCCADADGNVVQDADWETNNGHYRVKVDKEWYDVPDDAVVKAPNLFGPTMVWPMYSYGWGGGTTPRLIIRCFMPGVMT